MSQLEIADNQVTATERQSSAYVPPLQRTAGQPPPIAANGGLSYMAFDRDGDAGTAEALKDALAEIAAGEGQRVSDMIAKAPPGPIKTKWGLGFRDYDECMKYIRESNSIKAPPGGVALPLPTEMSGYFQTRRFERGGRRPWSRLRPISRGSAPTAARPKRTGAARTDLQAQP